MNNKLLILIISGILLSQCNSKQDRELEYVYHLSSPNGNFDIYESYIESSYAFGSGNFSTTIVKRGEKYDPWEPGNFLELTILGWVGNDTLRVIEFHKKQDKEEKIPATKLHEVSKYLDFYLDIIHLTSYGGELDWFKFDSISFTRDSVIFFQFDNKSDDRNRLGFLKGQIRVEIANDTVSKIKGRYFEKIEDHFEKITEGNELGYPYVVGLECEITPKYKMKPAIFDNQCVMKQIDIEKYKQ